jgi:phosphatidate cytidylyltransferase
MLRQRVITALILAALLMAALFKLPPYGWSLLVLVIVLLGTVEWARLSNLSGTRAAAYSGLTAVLMAGLAAWRPADGAGGMLQVHLAIYALAVAFWLLVAAPWLVLGWHVRQPLALALIGWVVLIPTGLAMIDVRAQSPALLLGLMAAVWLADVAAYFSGKRFGRRKLAPSISPGKTWEGVAGAIVSVSIYAAIVGWSSGHVRSYAGLVVLIAVSWLWVIVSVEGDLFESAIKRQAGVKDSGTLLPGHGGVLDRIDAMTSTLPLGAFALLLAEMLKVLD